MDGVSARRREGRINNHAGPLHADRRLRAGHVVDEVFSQRVDLVYAMRNHEDHRLRVHQSGGWFRDSFTITARRLTELQQTRTGDEPSLYVILTGMQGVKRYLAGEERARWTSEQWRDHLGMRAANYPGFDYYRQLDDGHLRQLMRDLKDQDPGPLAPGQLPGFMQDPTFAMHRVIAYADKRAAHAGVPDVIMNAVGDLPVDEATRYWWAANPSFDDMVQVQKALEAAAHEVATFYGWQGLARAHPVPQEPLAERAECWLRRHRPHLPRRRDRGVGRALAVVHIGGEDPPADDGLPSD